MAVLKAALLDQIEADSETVVTTGVALEEIKKIEASLRIGFPPSYIQLMERHNGGEFRYLRMHRIEEIQAIKQAAEMGKKIDSVGDLVRNFSQMRDYIPEFAQGLAFPFASSWGGDFYCFDLTQRREDGEYPILVWDHEMAEEPEDLPFLWRQIAPSFAEFLEDVYKDDE